MKEEKTTVYNMKYVGNVGSQDSYGMEGGTPYFLADKTLFPRRINHKFLR